METLSDMSALPDNSGSYRKIRKAIGTQQTVADRLGIDRVTVARRETGALPITREAALAILSLNETQNMKTIIYPATNGTPTEGAYGLYLDTNADSLISHAVIVFCGLHGWNSDEGRDAVLNSIVEKELRGVRIDLIRFIVVMDHNSPESVAKEFTILPDITEFKKRGNFLERFGAIFSVNVVGGSTTLSTDFENGQLLSVEETAAALKKAGMR